MGSNLQSNSIVLRDDDDEYTLASSYAPAVRTFGGFGGLSGLGGHGGHGYGYGHGYGGHGHGYGGHGYGGHGYGGHGYGGHGYGHGYGSHGYGGGHGYGYGNHRYHGGYGSGYGKSPKTSVVVQNYGRSANEVGATAPNVGSPQYGGESYEQYTPGYATQTSCGQQLLFSCQPSTQTVPCSGSGGY